MISQKVLPFNATIMGTKLYVQTLKGFRLSGFNTNSLKKHSEGLIFSHHDIVT